MICGPDARMELACVDACIICDIDGFRGRNDTQGQGDKPPSFCTSINHNIQWIGFLANSRDLTLQLDVSNCEGGSRPDGGLEAGVFEVDGCRIDEATAVSNCDSDIAQGTTQEFRMTDLTPGAYYYFIIDGNNGDVCDYTVRVTAGTTRVPDVPTSGGLRGPTRVCEGQPFTYRTSRVSGAPYYDWTLDGEVLGEPSDLEQTLTFDAAGIYEVCVTASNLCNAGPRECLEVRVGDFAPTRVEQTTCDNRPVTIAGAPRSESGEWTVVLDNSVGCDSTVTYALEVFATARTQRDTTICAGDAAPFDGRSLTAPGTYTAALQTADGCDSTVTLTLAVESCGYRAGALPTPVTCRGDADGALALYAVGPAPPYTAVVTAPDGTTQAYAVPPDSTLVVVADLPPGRYGVAFTDGYGVEQAYPAVVEEPLALRVAVVAAQPRPGFELTCAGGTDGALDARATGGTAPYTYVWADGARASDGARDGLRAGDYAVRVADARGCVATADATLREPDALPLTEVAVTTCAGDPVVIAGAPRERAGVYRETLRSYYGCDSTVATTLEVLAEAETRLSETICAGRTFAFDGRRLAEAGTYTQVLETYQGCDSTVTLALAVEDCSYRLTVDPSPARCNGEASGAVAISVEGPGGPYVGSWVADGDSGIGATVTLDGDGSPLVVGDLAAGDYVVEVSGVHGIRESATVSVAEPAPLSAAVEASAVGAFSVSCAGAADASLSLAPSGGTAPYAADWASGERSLTRTNLAPGTYAAVVTDANGCEAAVEAAITEPPPLALDVLPEARGCTDDEPGGVYLSGLDGGHGGYRLFVDGSFAGPPRDYYALDTGLHTLVLADAEGCELTRRALVEATPVPAVAHEPQVFIALGDTARLDAEVSGDVVRVDWSGGPGLSCLDCPRPRVAPTETTTYAVQVVNREGCTATAEVVVYVRRERTVAAPTAISPDGDGRNDAFTLYSSDPTLVIEELRVFDRWGNALWAGAELPVGDDALGWDGHHRGRAVQAGVFVWWARVRDAEGLTEVLRGDVTVLP